MIGPREVFVWRGSGTTVDMKLAKDLKDALTPREPTKAELYEEAARLGVRGRSKMNKGALKAAVARSRYKQRPVMAPR